MNAEGIVTMFTGDHHAKTTIKLLKTVDAVTYIGFSFGCFLYIVDVLAKLI